jgi:hypothetical protein
MFPWFCQAPGCWEQMWVITPVSRKLDSGSHMANEYVIKMGVLSCPEWWGQRGTLCATCQSMKWCSQSSVSRSTPLLPVPCSWEARPPATLPALFSQAQRNLSRHWAQGLCAPAATSAVWGLSPYAWPRSWRISRDAHSTFQPWSRLLLIVQYSEFSTSSFWKFIF